MDKYILNISLIVLSFILSRSTFLLINDTEGPNLLIVLALALVIFVVLRIVVKVILKK